MEIRVSKNKYIKDVNLCWSNVIAKNTTYFASILLEVYKLIASECCCRELIKVSLYFATLATGNYCAAARAQEGSGGYQWYQAGHRE